MRHTVEVTHVTNRAVHRRSPWVLRQWRANIAPAMS